MKRLILCTKLKVESWKDLTNGLQSNRQECHIETQIPLDIRIKQQTKHKISTSRVRHQIKIATSKLSNSMIFFKFAHVADEFHNAISHKFKITASQWWCCRWTQMYLQWRIRWSFRLQVLGYMKVGIGQVLCIGSVA